MASFPDVPDALATPFVHAVLRTHPNTHAVRPELPLHASALGILRAYLAPADPPPDSHALPPELAVCIAAVRMHQLPRSPIPLHAPTLPMAHTQGMSPKKAHEVARMAAYVVALVRASSLPEESLHIVDVGAGQGYLTRALKARLPRAHILALDADEAQTAGAQKWERRILEDAKPPIAHRTVLIGEDTLLRAVGEWIEEGDGVAKGSEREVKSANTARAMVPVLFVALHACGSLTPDVLRAFIAARRRTTLVPAWYPAAAVAVGCCYNLMDPSDFPLSTAYRTHPTLPVLPPAAFHLAAQIPSTWVKDPASSLNNLDDLILHPSAALAIRKVVWRALLERALQGAMPTPDEPSASKPFISSPTSPPIDSTVQSTAQSKTKNKSATVPAHWPRRPEQWLPSPSSSEALQDHTAASPIPPTDPIGSEAANAHLAASSGIGMTPALRRLGRLRDAAYAGSWAAFLSLAAERMGVIFSKDADADDNGSTPEGARNLSKNDSDKDEFEYEDKALLGALPRALRPQARALAALHVLRCIIGVLVESAVLRDRAAWVAEELELGLGGSCGMIDEPMRVALVNLFDQGTGSGRNVAIVLAPVLPPPAEE